MPTRPYKLRIFNTEQGKAEHHITVLHSRVPAEYNATSIQTIIDEKFNNLFGGFAVAITS
jgi:hypothetical protein